MSDGSWHRDGVLHLRMPGYQVPPKAVEYLKVPGYLLHQSTYVMSSTKS